MGAGQPWTLRGRRSTFSKGANYLSNFPDAVGAASDWSIENNGVGDVLFFDLEGVNVLGIMPPLIYLLSNVRATFSLGVDREITAYFQRFQHW